MRRDALRVALIGASSGALYLVVYLTQRGMFLNGLGEAPVDRTRLLFEAGVYYGATVLLFALYVWVLLLCRRGLLHDRARTLALLFPVLFNLGLLFGNPHQSIDALTYVAHGYLGNLPDANPYITAAASVEDTDFGRQLASLYLSFAVHSAGTGATDRWHSRSCEDRAGSSGRRALAVGR
ncbi:MAG: hypothetical protein ACR2JR_01100, partial [Rubrobacteraceae bacterium]